MKNKIIIDILERLIQEIHKHNLSYRYYTDDNYIVWVEGVIEGLKYACDDKTKQDGGIADDGE